MFRLDVHINGLLVIDILQFRHLERDPLLGRSLHDLVQETEHVRYTKVECVIAGWKIVFGIAFFVLPNVELRVLIYNRMVR
jgi:hypothetical protein